MLRILLLLLLPTCGGCTLITLSSLSSLASLGDTSVSVGRDTYFFGKLKSAEMASFNEARQAAKSAAADLGLELKYPEHVADCRSEMLFVDDHGSEVGVQIDRRASHLVRLRVDVGLFGSEPTGRMFLMRMRVYMPAAPPTTMQSAQSAPGVQYYAGSN